MPFCIISLATIGVCVFCAVTSVAALFILRRFIIMNKEKLIELIASHRKIFQLCANTYNNLNINNKLRARKSKLSIGISMLKGLKIVNCGFDNEVIIGDFVRIKNSTIIIRGNQNKVIISDFAYLNEIELYMEDSNNEISIGKHTSLCGKAHLATIEGTKITIGEHCLFSSGLHFRTGDSHSILDMNGERINPSKDIVIEDHVWIGTKVTCLKGVRVSKDSMVAATTTLCKDYSQKNVIIGGVPGKIIKTNINWTSKRI